MGNKNFYETLIRFYNEITADLVVSEETKAALGQAGQELNESGYFRNSLTLLASDAVSDYTPSVREVKEDLEWFFAFNCA